VSFGLLPFLISNFFFFFFFQFFWTIFSRRIFSTLFKCPFPRLDF
jgi:hypothetical protein